MLIQKGSTPLVAIFAGPASPIGVAYGVIDGNGTPAVGAGGTATTSVIVGGISYYYYLLTLTAGETNTLGTLRIVVNDGTGGIVGEQENQVVNYDPAVGPTGGDPWATPLPGAYAAGQAGQILGTLEATLPGEILDQANGVETGITPRDALKALVATLVGLVPNTGGTVVYQNPGGTKNRAIVTLGAGGRRTSVLLDFS